MLPSLIPTLEIENSDEWNSHKNSPSSSENKNTNTGRNCYWKDTRVTDRASLIEFGTIMVYTCQNSCMPGSLIETSGKSISCNTAYLEEQIMLQSESIQITNKS